MKKSAPAWTRRAVPPQSKGGRAVRTAFARWPRPGCPRRQRPVRRQGTGAVPGQTARPVPAAPPGPENPSATVRRRQRPSDAAAAASPTTGMTPCNSPLPVRRAALSAVAASALCSPSTRLNSAPQPLSSQCRQRENSAAASPMPGLSHKQAETAKQKYSCMTGRSSFLDDG